MHAGHIAFALQAVKAAKLDVVYFMPDRNPRRKHVEHYAHRVAMIRRALKPHTNLEVLETEEKQFTVRRTLTNLHKKFPSLEIVFLVGSDVCEHMHLWPHVEQLLQSSELCVGLRDEHEEEEVLAAIEKLPCPPLRTHLVTTFSPDVSSSKIRAALKEHKSTNGLLKSVYNYVRKEWLYLHS